MQSDSNKNNNFQNIPARPSGRRTDGISFVAKSKPIPAQIISEEKQPTEKVENQIEQQEVVKREQEWIKTWAEQAVDSKELESENAEVIEPVNESSNSTDSLENNILDDFSLGELEEIDSISDKNNSFQEKRETQPVNNSNSVQAPSLRPDLAIPMKMEWQGREYIKPERGANWYLYMGVFTIILVLIAILGKQPIPAVLFVLIAIVIYLMGDKEPDMITIKLQPKGLIIENKLYPYNELKSFWIFYDPPRKRVISFISKRVYMPALVVQLEDENPVIIRRYLLKYLPEEEQEENFLDGVAERLKLQ